MSTPAATVNPTLTAAYTAILAFIMSVTGLPDTQVIKGVVNRAAMPAPDFITIQFLNQRRLRTAVTSFDKTSGPPSTVAIEAEYEYVFQIDCYGTQSNIWATALMTLLRSAYGVDQLSPSGVTPLYADDARMMPTVFAEDQYEDERWSLDAHFQINPVTTVPQQYADALELTLVNVQERFPA